MDSEAAQAKPALRESARGLRAACEIYDRWQAQRERLPLDRVVDAEFRSRRYLNAGERRWIADVLYGSVRYLRRQTHLLETLGLPVSTENLIRLWRPSDPAHSPETYSPIPPVTDSSVSAPAVEALVSEEAYSAVIAGLPGPQDPHDHLRVALSFSDAMAEALEAQLGKEAMAAAVGLNRQAPTTLRVNTLRVGREAAMARLSEVLPVQPTRYSPWGIELPRRITLPDLPGFSEGWFEIQEEASQIVVLLAGAQPGETVVEVGAGGGGKTVALAAAMQNRGRLMAIDTSAPRLENVLKRAKRAGARHVRIVEVDAESDGAWRTTGKNAEALASLQGSADVVLLDAPCTGSGVLRRSPDAKWRQFDLHAVTHLQRQLLRQSAELVAPGGLLLYVTCAFEKNQDEDIVAAFLGEPGHGSFTLDPVSARLPPELAGLADGPFLRTWPHRHGLDAFFAACLRRSAQ